MSPSAFLVNHLDFARSFQGDPWQATPQTIADWLSRNWLNLRGGGIWNYLPAMDVLVLAYERNIGIDQAIEHCRRYWHTHARLENERVVRAFWRFALDHRSRVYKRPSLAAPVGRWRDRNIFIGIKAPLIRVQGDDAFAVMPVFRKNFVPNDAETNLALTAVREFCRREGYRDLDTELIRAAGVSGTTERRLIVDHGSKRQLYSADEFDEFARKYVSAVCLLADAGLGLRMPNFRGYRIWDPDQPSMV